jgi:hypothetical protein
MQSLPFAQSLALGCRLAVVRSKTEMRALSTTVHSEARPPASAWAARPSATSAPAFACHHHRLRLLNRQGCMAIAFVRQNSVPARCHFLQAPSELPQAPAVANRRRAWLVRHALFPLSSVATAVRRAFSSLNRLVASLYVEPALQARYRSGAYSQPIAAPQPMKLRVRPNPSFNLTRSGLRPPRAS